MTGHRERLSLNLLAVFVLAGLLCYSSFSAYAGPYPAQLPRTGQTTSYGTGDDGALQAGVPWPDPRLTDNNDGTVTDNLTGLVWLKNANCFGAKNWQDSLVATNSLAGGSCGLSDRSRAGDWRLPNINELKSLIDFGHISPDLPVGHPFTGLASSDYWSSTTCSDITELGWVVSLYLGIVESGAKNSTSYYVWPVRGKGASDHPIKLPKTGQTKSYSAYDDGDLQVGASWPDSRFTDNRNGTVTDNLTGLTWLKDSNCLYTQTWATALTNASTLTSPYCGLTDGSQTGDWRLPNMNELMSLIDYSRSYDALPKGHPFTNIYGLAYWCSTNFGGNLGCAIHRE